MRIFSVIIPIVFVKLRLRDGVLCKEQFQCLDLTEVQFFARELPCISE